MKTLKKAIAVALTSLVISGPATAGIFTYDVDLGRGIGNASLAIDSEAATATYTGANVNLTFTSSELLGFDGTTSPRAVYRADDISGTIFTNGKTYNTVLSPTRNTVLRLDGDVTSIWTQLENAAGATRGFDVSGNTTYAGLTNPTPPLFAEPPSGSTPPGSSSGGGSVPVPATALFILAGFAGIGGAMRRKKKAL